MGGGGYIGPLLNTVHCQTPLVSFWVLRELGLFLLGDISLLSSLVCSTPDVSGRVGTNIIRIIWILWWGCPRSAVLWYVYKESRVVSLVDTMKSEGMSLPNGPCFDSNMQQHLLLFAIITNIHNHSLKVKLLYYILQSIKIYFLISD